MASSSPVGGHQNPLVSYDTPHEPFMIKHFEEETTLDSPVSIGKRGYKNDNDQSSLEPSPSPSDIVTKQYKRNNRQNSDHQYASPPSVLPTKITKPFITSNRDSPDNSDEEKQMRKKRLTRLALIDNLDQFNTVEGGKSFIYLILPFTIDIIYFANLFIPHEGKQQPRISKLLNNNASSVVISNENTHLFNISQKGKIYYFSNDKFNGTKKSLISSMNLIERQKLKAMHVVEKMHQQFQQQLQRDAQKTIDQEQRERQQLLWQIQLEKQRESRNRKRIEQIREVREMTYKEKVTKEKERKIVLSQNLKNIFQRSLEQARKRMEDIEREMQLDEQRRNMEREKERKKREAAERGQLAVLEAKARKMEIDQMQREKLNELKSRVREKERQMEDKYQSVHDDKQHRAAELRAKNEERIRQALSREHHQREMKHSKDVGRVQAIEAYKLHTLKHMNFQNIQPKSSNTET